MKHRLFFAITCPQVLQNQVVALQRDLDKLQLPVVWQEASKLHMTLNFLGNKVDSGDLTGIRRAAFNVISATPKFEMTMAFLETLYQRHEETLIYVAPHKLPELLDLQNKLCIAFNELNLPQPKRFLPHITIGQLKRTDPVTTKECIQKISKIDFKPFEPFTVDHIDLMESYVSAKGSHYQKIGEFMLQS